MVLAIFYYRNGKKRPLKKRNAMKPNIKNGLRKVEWRPSRPKRSRPRQPKKQVPEAVEVRAIFFRIVLVFSTEKEIVQYPRETLAPEISKLKQLCEKVNNRVPSRLEFQDLHSTAGTTLITFQSHIFTFLISVTQILK